MRTLIVTLVAVLSAGCATCRTHPVACTIVGAVVVGSITATVVANSHNDNRQTQSEKFYIRPELQ